MTTDNKPGRSRYNKPKLKLKYNIHLWRQGRFRDWRPLPAHHWRRPAAPQAGQGARYNTWSLDIFSATAERRLSPRSEMCEKMTQTQQQPTQYFRPRSVDSRRTGTQHTAGSRQSFLLITRRLDMAGAGVWGWGMSCYWTESWKMVRWSPPPVNPTFLLKDININILILIIY